MGPVPVNRLVGIKVDEDNHSNTGRVATVILRPTWQDNSWFLPVGVEDLAVKLLT